MKRKAPAAAKSKSPDQLNVSDPKISLDAAALTGRPCPICGKPATVEMRPFCSKRCADIDLHHWLGGSYAIPVVEQNSGNNEDPDEEA